MFTRQRFPVYDTIDFSNYITECAYDSMHVYASLLSPSMMIHCAWHYLQHTHTHISQHFPVYDSMHVYVLQFATIIIYDD